MKHGLPRGADAHREISERGDYSAIDGWLSVLSKVSVQLPAATTSPTGSPHTVRVSSLRSYTVAAKLHGYEMHKWRSIRSLCALLWNRRGKREGWSPGIGEGSPGAAWGSQLVPIRQVSIRCAPHLVTKDAATSQKLGPINDLTFCVREDRQITKGSAFLNYSEFRFKLGSSYS